jgi:hypothetical protein
VENVRLIALESDHIIPQLELGDADRALMVHRQFVFLAHLDTEAALLTGETRHHVLRAYLQSLNRVESAARSLSTSALVGCWTGLS